MVNDACICPVRFVYKYFKGQQEVCRRNSGSMKSGSLVLLRADTYVDAHGDGILHRAPGASHGGGPLASPYARRGAGSGEVMMKEKQASIWHRSEDVSESARRSGEVKSQAVKSPPGIVFL